MQHLYIDMIPIPMTHMTTFWLLVRMNPVHCLVGGGTSQGGLIIPMGRMVYLPTFS